MSIGCRVNVHFCYTETNEIAKWDAKCDEQRFEWTDSFAQVRSRVCSGAILQQFEPEIQERISFALSKGDAETTCRLRMYVMPHDASARSSLSSGLPLEIVDEDLSVSAHFSFCTAFIKTAC